MSSPMDYFFNKHREIVDTNDLALQLLEARDEKQKEMLNIETTHIELLLEKYHIAEMKVLLVEIEMDYTDALEMPRLDERLIDAQRVLSEAEAAYDKQFKRIFGDEDGDAM